MAISTATGLVPSGLSRRSGKVVGEISAKLSGVPLASELVSSGTNMRKLILAPEIQTASTHAVMRCDVCRRKKLFVK
jgi:hypothetical protein